MSFSSFLKNLISGNQPDQKQDLENKVAAAISSAPNNTLICAVADHYLPHGGRGELWVTLSPGGGHILRTRSPEQGEEIKLNRQCTADESLRIREMLKKTGAWVLEDSQEPITDGWRCEICLAEGEILHLIRMNVATGEHLRLLRYLYGLLPIAEDHYGRLTDVLMDDAHNNSFNPSTR
jgi:hypothetical protein